MTTDSKGQQVTWEMLTIDEQRVLKKIHADGTININELPLKTWHSIYAKELVSFAYSGLTPTGRAVLAQAAPPSELAAIDASTMLTRGDVETLIRSNQRFDAIRYVHIKNGLSIKDAREYVNKVASELSLQQTIDIGKKTLDTLESEIATAQQERDAALAEAAALREFVYDFADMGNNRHLNDQGVVFAYLDYRKVARKLIEDLALAASEKGG